MNRWRLPRSAAVLVITLAAVVGLSGCAEKLDGSAACPITCTEQSAQIQTVVLDAIASSTTVPGGLGKGTEARMLLASRGDTLDTRVIIRFDALPTRTKPSASDTATTPISIADSVYLMLHVDSSAVAAGVPVTLSVYDVDTDAANDTSAAVLAPLFTADRLIASQEFAAGKLADSVSIRLPNSVVLAKAKAGQRLRLGLQISASKPVSLRVASSEIPIGPVLSLRTSADTAVKPVLLVPNSATPADNRSIARSLGDFTIVVNGTAPPDPGLLAVGGLPPKRAYLRFNIPSRIVDSSLVIRATLLLTQQGSASPSAADTMYIRPFLVLAGPSVTDPAKAAQITADSTVTRFALLRTVPAASGVREVEIAPAFGFWAAQGDSLLPRALVLQSALEAVSAQQALFYSSSVADPALRPKLRISYTFRSRIGVP